MNSPFFSVVIPLYNKEAYIKRAIDSVLKQSFIDFELIVINDGSTDNSVNIVKLYNDNRIKLIEQNNKGVSAARNKGISIANGDYIAFLDADDEWRENFLSEINTLIKLFPYAGLYATSYSVCRDIKGNVINETNITNYKRYEMDYFKEAYNNKFPVHTSAVCIPKQIFENVGLFLIDVHLGEDLEMWARIALKYKIAYSTKKCSIYYRNTGNNVTSKISLIRLAQAETIQKILAEDDFLQKNVFYIKEYLAKCDLYHSRQLILHNFKKEAETILIQCETHDQKFKLYILKMALFLPGPLLLITHKLVRIIKRIVWKIY